MNRIKSRLTELNVDFIGGLGSLTAAEEEALSKFFKQQKLRSAKQEDKNQEQ